MPNQENAFGAKVNEIYLSYLLNGNKYPTGITRIVAENNMQKLSSNVSVTDQMGRAHAMREEFKKYCSKKGLGSVKKVYWTADGFNWKSVVGVDVDPKYNPTDVLVEFTSGKFMGISAKSTKMKSGGITFKNPGLGTISREFSLNFESYVKKKEEEFIKTNNLPKTQGNRKTAIRKDKDVSAKADEMGNEILSYIRDKYYDKLKSLPQDKIRHHILTLWMNASDMTYPPYIKITGRGTDTNFKADIEEPNNNPKVNAISQGFIKVSKAGKHGIDVKSGYVKIFTIGTKYNSQKLASSINFTGT